LPRRSWYQFETMPRCLPTIIAAFLVACGTPTYTEGTYAMATESLDELIARADEPLRSELAAHRAEFDRRMTALPTDPAARSAAIGDIYTEAMETRSTYQERILDDLRSRARPALAASGLIGYWSDNNYRLNIEADGRMSYSRKGQSTHISGEIIRVDPTGLRFQVFVLGSADREFSVEHAPRMEGTLRVIRVNGNMLRFWQ
jgi:hypothetical protein